MQFLSTLLSFTALLLPLVSADACVAGGPAGQVTFAKSCCLYQEGTWYQYYDNQAICVLAEGLSASYKRCINRIPRSELDTTCIPGNGSLTLGNPTTTLSTVTGRITLTAAAASAAV
ncbi:uncharacterized protein RAG0_08907 [Rhynchosporium agropyri]|uniref:Uncharacterized protein n=1 Tax=Rhynchosporium agropyri TaxID=914238 RepID=A0A1E1KSV1_9HELO|nr:uncharacterized protein RAG0_08907 [Rhynchosporium agropyri]